MLVQLGQRTPTSDLVDLLAECHHRIRRFLALATKIATTRGAPAGEVRTIAGQVQRYFAMAFPLHLADEEEEIEPRLEGVSADIDRALAQMHAEHALHEPKITRLVELCALLERDPRLIDAIRDRLAEVAAELTSDLEAHLVLEERLIFPALAQLPDADRKSIVEMMRARRM
jgi:iron-sulfur cluster repair protein YtfE (RIC family)